MTALVFKEWLSTHELEQRSNHFNGQLKRASLPVIVVVVAEKEITPAGFLGIEYIYTYAILAFAKEVRIAVHKLVRAD
jgi:hypothetical protein